MKQYLSFKRWLPVLVYFLAGLLAMLKPIADLDELWNYGFSGSVCRGMVPYRDFNMVQTPLAAWLGGVFLRIFGQDLVVFRILGAVLYASVFGVMHQLLCRITGKSAEAFVAASFAAALCALIWMYNYNHLNLLVLLLGLYVRYVAEQKEGTKALRLRCLAGFLWGLMPVIKQSTGAVVLLFHFGACGVAWLRRRQTGRDAALQSLFALLPGTVFGLWLVISGVFPDFWDYAVAGVSTFSHRQRWMQYILSGPIDFAVGCFPLLVTALSVDTIWKKRSVVSREYHVYCLCACWAGAFVAYPICDFVHMCVAAVPFVIPLLCCAGRLRLTGKESVICCAVAALVLSCPGILWFEKLPTYKTCELPCYEGLPVEPELENQLRIVGDYVLQMEQSGTAVLIADPSAAAYMQPIGQYDRDFNLLLVGNVGTKTAEQLLYRENAVYLILPADVPPGNQAHGEVIAYIRAHYEKIGEVSCFEAYATNQE